MPPATDLLRAKARTFWFASHFLPAQRRHAVAGLYVFARTLDDLVDEPEASTSADDIRATLADWRAWVDRPHLHRAPDQRVAAAVAPALLDHGVPPAYLHLLIDGVASDLQPREIHSWPQLRTYCVQVASSVGLAMCHLLGVGDDPLARRAAIELGIAMQLTNILRDIGADLQAGRVYLTTEDLTAHQYSRQRLTTLAARVATDGPRAIDLSFRQLMQTQIERARAHYGRGLDGIPRLPTDCRLTILVAARLYRAILDAIEAADYDVFTHRAATSRWLKLSEAVRCSLSVRLHDRDHRPAVSVAGVQR